ncbi:hypothetical protein [Thiolapillus sp.]
MANSTILFAESGAAAQSQKNAWTRMASSWKSISVELTPQTLTVMPHRFAKWLAALLDLDLQHAIPVADILSVKETGAHLNPVEVSFTLSDGSKRELLLYLKKHREFIEAIAKARKSSSR